MKDLVTEQPLLFFAIIVLFILVLTVTGCASINQSVKAGDATIGYRTIGDGYPLVMIMGFSATMDLWDPTVLAILSSRYRVIIFDNRGMGYTDAGDRQFSIEQFAKDTAQFMEALGIERTHVLGFSMGTNIAQELALRRPEKVNKLVLYAADCGGDFFPTPPEVERILRDTSGTEEECGKRLLQIMFPREWLEDHGDYVKKVFSRPMKNSSPDSIRRQSDAMHNWKGCCDRLHLIEHQVLLITGTEDVATLPQYSQMMSEKMQNAKLVTVEGAGHGLMFQFPEQFAEAVLDFLK